MAIGSLPRLVVLVPMACCARLASGAAVAAARTPAIPARSPLYVFSGSEAERDDALQRFQRIDDVIMGGVSKSKLMAGDGCASWRGLVRTEGGGFCGQRTCPFKYPLNASGADGVYLDCRLASDSEPEKRVWKLTLRTQEGRGEVVYQAPFAPLAGGALRPVYVPFSDFRLVRGPVAVPGAPKLERVGVLHQLGFTVSKFVMGETMTTLDDFRNGTFQLDVGELGLFTDGVDDSWSGTEAPPAVPEAEALQSRPLAERVLTPVFRALFNEKKRRRRRAAELLVQRGASRMDLARAGWRFKRRLRGRSAAASALETVGEGAGAVVGGAAGALFKVLVFPLLGRMARRRRQRELERAKAGGSPAD